MRPTKFLIGMTSGAVLVLLVTGALLLGFGQLATSAQGGTPTSSSAKGTATPDKQSAADGTPSRSIARDALEQSMLQPVSDAEWNAAAQMLGTTADDLDSQLKADHSVGELGSAKGVTAQQIRDAMIAAGQGVVSASLQTGTITQAEADQLNQGLVVAIADKVTSANTQPEGTPGPDAQQIKDQAIKKGAPSADAQTMDSVNMAELNAAAQVLGITTDQFKMALGQDGNLGQYLTAKNVTAQQVKEAMIAAGQAALDQVVQSGTISQADADQARTSIVQGIAEKIYQLLTNSGDATPAP